MKVESCGAMNMGRSGWVGSIEKKEFIMDLRIGWEDIWKVYGGKNEAIWRYYSSRFFKILLV